MASLGKREFAKKDMNFFSEFAASAQASARMLRNLIFIGIIVIGILVAVIIFLNANLLIKKSKIKEYDEKFKTEAYVTAQSRATELANKSARTNEYAYAMVSMDATVKKETGVKFEIINQIETHIPDNVIVTKIQLDKGLLIVEGQTTSYYAPTELANMINENKIFGAADDVNIVRYDPSEMGNSEYFVTNYQNGRYTFSLQCPLDVQYLVTVSRVTSADVVISIPTNELVDSNSPYNVDIAPVTIAGEEYTLAAIKINGKTISAEELQAAIMNESYSVYVNDDVKIELVYEKPVTEEEAEAK